MRLDETWESFLCWLLTLVAFFVCVLMLVPLLAFFKWWLMVWGLS